jgi:hypothetical protein
MRLQLADIFFGPWFWNAMCYSFCHQLILRNRSRADKVRAPELQADCHKFQVTMYPHGHREYRRYLPSTSQKLHRCRPDRHANPGDRELGRVQINARAESGFGGKAHIAVTSRNFRLGPKADRLLWAIETLKRTFAPTQSRGSSRPMSVARARGALPEARLPLAIALPSGKPFRDRQFASAVRRLHHR